MIKSFFHNNKEGHVIGIVLVISILLPHTGILYLANPIILFLLARKTLTTKNISFVQMCMVLTVFVSLVWNALYGVEITTKSLVRAIYICEIVLFFPFCRNYPVPNFYAYFIVTIIVLSQVCYIYNLGFFISFFEKLYPITEENVWETSDYLVSHAQDATSINDLQSIRFGGLFRNANRCMKYITLCMVFYMVENFGKPFKKQIVFFFLILVSAFLAGSRTGFMIIFVSFFLYYSIQHSRQEARLGLFNAKIIFSIVIILLLFYVLSQVSSLRIFQVAFGGEKDGSMEIKYHHLAVYLSLLDEIRPVLVGNFSMESVATLYHTPFTAFDSEWGDAIYMYGFVFTMCYVMFLLKVFAKLRGRYLIVSLLLLWIVSSTILLSYRTSFAFFLVLSKYYNGSMNLLKNQ